MKIHQVKWKILQKNLIPYLMLHQWLWSSLIAPTHLLSPSLQSPLPWICKQKVLLPPTIKQFSINSQLFSRLPGQTTGKKNTENHLKLSNNQIDLQCRKPTFQRSNRRTVENFLGRLFPLLRREWLSRPLVGNECRQNFDEFDLKLSWTSIHGRLPQRVGNKLCWLAPKVVFDKGNWKTVPVPFQI